MDTNRRMDNFKTSSMTTTASTRCVIHSRPHGMQESGRKSKTMLAVSMITCGPVCFTNCF